MSSSDRKRSIVDQVKAMSRHHSRAGTAKWTIPWAPPFETSLGRRDYQRLPGVWASGEHRAVGADQGQDGERIPNAVTPPLASAGAHRPRPGGGGADPRPRSV